MGRTSDTDSGAQRTEVEQRLADDTLRKIVVEATRLKGIASEYVGQRGNYQRNQCERHSLHVRALNLMVQLNGMDTVKRQDFIRAFVQYAVQMGYLDQMDAFDDLATLLRRILERNDSAPAAPDEFDAAAPNVTRLRSGIKALDELSDGAA